MKPARTTSKMKNRAFMGRGFRRDFNPDERAG
jgi:hypothetical protein